MSGNPFSRATPGRGRGTALGGACLAAFALCVLLMITLGLLGPSSTEPIFGPAGKSPPWFWDTRPSDPLILVLVAVLLVLAAGAVAAGFAAMRRGWAPRPRALLAGSGLAVAGLLCVPPLGTTDPLNYAAYGRMAAIGLDPYRTTPWDLAFSGDPIGRLAIAEPWLNYPSVYGPLVTATEWAASVLGGASMLRTVWLLSVVAGAAFVATGALLLRLAGPDPARRVRSQLVWSLNPVLLWNLVAGPHVDVLGALCLVAAFSAVRRSGVAVGVAVAAAATVKLTLGLFALPLAWSLRNDRRRLAAAGAAGGLLLAAGYTLAAPAIRNAARVSEQAAVGTPWPMLSRRVLVPLFGPAGGQQAMAGLEITLVAVLAALLMAALPPPDGGHIVQQAARPALAFAAAYLLGSAYVRPWYDAVAWLLIALLPRSWFDPVLLAHTTLMTLPFDPGLPYTMTPRWMNTLVIQVGDRIAPALQTVLLLVVVALCIQRIRRRSRECAATPVPGLPSPAEAGAE